MLTRLGTKLNDRFGLDAIELVNTEIEKAEFWRLSASSQVEDLSSSMVAWDTLQHTEKGVQEIEAILDDSDSQHALFISAMWSKVRNLIEKVSDYMMGHFANLSHAAQTLIGASSSSTSGHAMGANTVNPMIVSGITGVVIFLVVGYHILARLGYLERPWIKRMLGKTLRPYL